MYPKNHMWFGVKTFTAAEMDEQPRHFVKVMVAKWWDLEAWASASGW